MLKLYWKKYLAECVGTAMLTLVACGIAALGGGLFTTALAFGLVIMFAAFFLGPISGGHFNPAVSLAMLIRKKLSFKEFWLYLASQFVGAFVGSLILLAFLGNFTSWGTDIFGLGQNEISQVLMQQTQDGLVMNAWSYIGGFLVEVCLTFGFVMAIFAATDEKHGVSKFAPVLIGLALTLVHLLGIGLTGTSVNPARSLAPSVLMALFGKTTSLTQVWIWLVAPMCGGALAALVYGLFDKSKPAAQKEEKPAEEPKAE